VNPDRRRPVISDGRRAKPPVLELGTASGAEVPRD
jgi:hypothetical protein